MKEYIERMIDEYNELKERVDKLGTFLNGDVYKSLNLEEQNDLMMQYHSMVIYKIALDKRLRRRGIVNSQDKA